MKFNAVNFKVKGDRTIWIIYIVLLFISLLEVYSAMGKMVYEKQGGDIIRIFLKHFGIILGGLVVTYFFHLIRYQWYSKFIKAAYVLSTILLGFTLLWGQFSTKAADRWIELPIIGQFQPSEIAKYVLILYVAKRLAILKDGIKERKKLLGLMGWVALTCILIFPENFSMSALIFVGCLLVVYIAGARLKDMMIVVLPIVILAAFLFIFPQTVLERSSTWSNRVESWWYFDENDNTQANTAAMAISTGGLFGKGIGDTTHGRFLSESHNDFIFAIILEETGVLGGIFVITLYVVLLARTNKIAQKSKGLFGRYIVIGIGFMITLQAIVNMSVATGIIPVTGQTLPFISFGGTSFMITSAALGILLNVSASTKLDNKNEETDDMESSFEKLELENDNLNLEKDNSI